MINEVILSICLSTIPQDLLLESIYLDDDMVKLIPCGENCDPIVTQTSQAMHAR